MTQNMSVHSLTLGLLGKTLAINPEARGALAPAACVGLLVQVMCDADGSHAGFTLPNPKKLGAIRAVYTGATARQTPAWQGGAVGGTNN